MPTEEAIRLALDQMVKAAEGPILAYGYEKTRPPYNYTSGLTNKTRESRDPSMPKRKHTRTKLVGAVPKVVD